VTQLTLEAARALLGDAYGIAKTEPLYSCRVNFFEPGVLAVPPGALVLVRQDMLGRRHTHSFELGSIADFALVSSRRRQTALRFVVERVVWQIDGLADEHLSAVIKHVSMPSAGYSDGAEPAELEELEELEELDLEPDLEEEGVSAGAGEMSPPQGGPGARSQGAPDSPLGSEARELRQEPTQAEPRRTPVDDLLGFLDEAVLTDPTADGLALLLHKLFVQSLAQEQTDRALLVAQSLLAIDRANPSERQLAARYQTDRILEALGELTEAHWSSLGELPPSELALQGVTSALTPALVRMTARSPRDYGLKEPPEGSGSLVFGRVFNYVRRVCSLPELRFHPLPDGPRGIAFANLSDDGVWAPTMVVGVDFLSGRTEAQLAYRIGHELTFLRREHLLRVLLPSLAQQAVLVLTAVALAVPDRPIPGEDEGVIRAQRSLLTKYMELEDFERLSAAVRRLLGQSQPFDLGRWNRAMERSALRVGMLLAGDVQVAARGAMESIGSVHEADRARAELIRFAVGNLHQRLRTELRLAVA
jgi:hypothetical protein